MTAEEAISYIHSVSWKGSVLGLSRIRRLLSLMGNPQDSLRFIHVAGTNGKGSTSAMCAQILREAGYRTGLFTSPYINEFCERIQLDGENIPAQQLAEITAFVRPLAESMEDRATEFELVTAIGFEYFRRSGCDIVVMEVGLGGELDSTNVIERPEAAVIMSIGLDHTEILGGSLAQIAEAKAGIIKRGCPVVAYRGTAEVEAVFARVCRERGAQLRLADFASIQPMSHDLRGQSFSFRGFSDLRLALLGEHQLKNAAVAIETMLLLRERGWDISDEAIRRGLQSVRWPARFELLSEQPVFILDGGHNPQCIAALVQNIRDYLPGRPLVFLVGLLADKDYRAMAELCAPLAMQIVTVTPESPRALPSAQLAEVFRELGKPVSDCGDVDEGVREALRLCPPEGAVCAFGSLYMSGTIRKHFI